jgi:hypothetical protein
MLAMYSLFVALINQKKFIKILFEDDITKPWLAFLAGLLSRK